METHVITRKEIMNKFVLQVRIEANVLGLFDWRLRAFKALVRFGCWILDCNLEFTGRE